MSSHIPDKVVNRLTLYHFILDDLDQDEKYISSSKIAQLLNIDNSQVRKDLKYLDKPGKASLGYEPKILKKAIEEKLGFKQTKNAFIVGAGNLGSALAKYSTFLDYGLNILAMFDSNESKIGTLINGKEVFEISKMKDLAKQLKVDIAILTVPKSSAQLIADFLVGVGIKYIWNFTPCILDVPKSVKVWNENLIGSFLQFTNNEEVTEIKNGN